MNVAEPNSFRTGPDERGHFGIYGGRFVAETLMPLILDLEKAYAEAKADPAFQREMAVHLRLKGGIGLGLRIGALEIENERHQRLGDEAAAIEPEMAALVRAGAIGIQRVRFGARAHEALARACAAADFAA